MIRIAIVDDEQSMVNELVKYLERYEEEKNEDLKISYFSDGDEIVEQYKAQFDIVFLDIQMRFMNGLETAQAIRKVDQEVNIIFVTNMTQFAMQGYKVDALDYVQKPISYISLAKCISKAIEKVRRNKTKFITVPVKNGAFRIDVSDIYYVESQKHVLVFHTRLGDVKTYGKMIEAEQQLERLNFCRGNKGYLINLSHVIGIKDNQAILRGEQLNLSRTRRNKFMEALAEYWGA
jgi:DNA-binding LytR/AlgR family response regulator